MTAFICEMLPEHMRETSRMELLYEDIEKLPVSEIARIAEWLTEKVDSLTTKTRAEPKEAEEEVGGAGHAALKATWHRGPQECRGSGEELASWVTMMSKRALVKLAEAGAVATSLKPCGTGEASDVQDLDPQDACFV